MNDLLYSIKSVKPTKLPFTFDDKAKGFDKGVWAKVSLPQTQEKKTQSAAKKD